MKSHAVKCTLLIVLWATAVPALAVTVSSPTTQWTAIQYANPSLADPSIDHQASAREGDIVGNATHASLYMGLNNGGTPLNLTDGEIAFRMRVSGDSNPSGFGSVFWIGIDVNLDGKLDIFTGATATSVGIYNAGELANTSPSTTSIDNATPLYEVTATASNFNFSAVTATSDPSATNFNLDGGSGGGGSHVDHFVSFLVPLNELALAIDGLDLAGMSSFNENTPMRYVAATSNQMNSLNQDLNGINGNINSATTWVDLGGFTPVVNSSGTPVPEPTAAGLAAAGLLALAARRKRA